MTETRYVVYGYVQHEGEFNHVYFNSEENAKEFQKYWEEDKQYMDSIELDEVEFEIFLTPDRLKEIVKEINN